MRLGVERIYTYFMNQIEAEYEPGRCLKDTPKGKLTLLRHKGSGQRYVLREFNGNAEAFRRLLSVDCPNLVRILEVAEENGRVAVLEEFVAGNSLSEMLKDTVFTPAEAKSIVRQLCCGLFVLHGLQVVHRDIKPENIILRGEQAVLLDFDASRVYKSEQSVDTQVLGTIGYAPPEQFGVSQTDGRADIYALGVLLNIMLTGKHPAQELAGGRLGRVVQRCTMTVPEKRYKDVLDLMNSL